jgi:predicted esterase YcpF (UPF0227 family)
MKILYIPGFNGSPEGAKLDMLRNNFKDAEIIAPKHDSNAENVFQLLDEVASNLEAPDDVILGSSLGGFWANYFSERYKIGAVLVNPVVKPSIALKEFGYPHASEYTQFEKQISRSVISPRAVLLAKGDEVLDYRHAYEYYSPQCHVEVNPAGDHRMNDPESLDWMRTELSGMWNSAICGGITNDD